MMPRIGSVSAARVRNRRLAAGVTTVAGAAALGWSFRVEPGSDTFAAAALVLAAVWFVGAVLTGLGAGPVTRHGTHRIATVVDPVARGLALAAVFVLGAIVVRRIDLLADATDEVLDYARRGSGPVVVSVTVVNGIAEETFFRGALHDVVGVRPALVTTTVYVAVTAASGSLMLAFAALVVGSALAAQRRRTGSWVAPAITHVTWSVAMLLALPALIPD